MTPIYRKMTAHVNQMGIVLRFGGASGLNKDEWEQLLDELRSHYIPSFYQKNKRLHVDVSAEGQMRAVIYFTPQTVSMDEAMAILKKWNIEVFDVRETCGDMKDFFQLLRDWFPLLKSHPQVVLAISVSAAALIALYKAKDLRSRIFKPVHSKLCHKNFARQRWLFVSKRSCTVDAWKYYTSEVTGSGNIGDDIIWTLVSWPSLKPIDHFVIHGAVGMESALQESQVKLEARWQIDHDPDGLGVGFIPARGIISKLRRAAEKLVHMLWSI